MIIDRYLHVYNFISGKILFEIQVPNANAFRHDSGCNHCMFVDNDKLLAIQDGESRVMMINIEASIETFEKQHIKEGFKDETQKRDELMDYDITDNFKKNYEDNNQAQSD